MDGLRANWSNHGDQCAACMIAVQPCKYIEEEQWPVEWKPAVFTHSSNSNLLLLFLHQLKSGRPFMMNGLGVWVLLDSWTTVGLIYIQQINYRPLIKTGYENRTWLDLFTNPLRIVLSLHSPMWTKNMEWNMEWMFKVTNYDN